MTEKPDRLNWQRSKDCADSACAEVAEAGDTVHLRNSAQPEVVVTYSRAEWEALKRGIAAGQF
ncbi:DUF397 domain-containing protein [Symbioplanes lichenis]|uniref:DUF397 domain-containing protein n=1 Tax=Symbioplanes lichenis TaxID=1629072 RepID=UPI002738E1D5|nr:DUF397 domain-containing protein [Actinoplanes lichenis]